MAGEAHEADEARKADAAYHESRLFLASQSSEAKQLRIEELRQGLADTNLAAASSSVQQPSAAERALEQVHRDFQGQTAALQSSQRTADLLS